MTFDFYEAALGCFTLFGCHCRPPRLLLRLTATPLASARCLFWRSRSDRAAAAPQSFPGRLSRVARCCPSDDARLGYPRGTTFPVGSRGTCARASLPPFCSVWLAVAASTWLWLMVANASSLAS